MKSLQITILVLLVWAPIALSAGTPPNENKPNVLLIIVDDLRPMIGAYGETQIQTPNIDSLAASGFVFENAYATVPVCGASRASLFSGRKPTTNRFVSYNARLDRDLPDAVSIPGYFRQNGYQTLAYGKVFDNQMDSADVWSQAVWSPSGDWTSSIPPDNRGEELQKAYQGNPAGVTGPAFERLVVSDTDYPDGRIAEQVVADLADVKHMSQPFFLTVGFRKPHLPFNAPARYWDLYDSERLELPSTYRELLSGAPSNPFHMLELRQYAGIPSNGPLKNAQAINLIYAYYAAVSYIDAQIGKVLDALQREGLARDTIVVLLGDHGFNLGEHTLWGKHNLSEVGVRSPLIIRDPPRGSGRIEGIVDFLDIFPTLVELTGLPSPSQLDGVSLVPVLGDPTEAVKAFSISRWFNGTSVRTSRYRYTEWRSEDGQVTASTLFDLLADPSERLNLSDDRQHEGVVRELHTIIEQEKGHSPWSPIIWKMLEE